LVCVSLFSIDSAAPRSQRLGPVDGTDPKGKVAAVG
jgi:hypothetical protein